LRDMLVVGARLKKAQVKTHDIRTREETDYSWPLYNLESPFRHMYVDGSVH